MEPARKAASATPDAAPPAGAGPEAAWTTAIVQFLRRHLEVSGAKGYVVGVSGGLDSAVVLQLCALAVGKEKVLPVILPAGDSDPSDEGHARLACRHVGVEPLKLDLEPAIQGFIATLGHKPDKRVLGNTKSRARVAVFYALAQERGYLACGTGNKSELLTGYFTKWGDGSADVMPIGDLFKTQVRSLARHLRLPEVFIQKPPSAGLHPGQTDEGDMGITYEELDAVLRLLELNHDVATAQRKSGLPLEKVEKVERMVRGSEHKRRLALCPKLGVRTVGIDWRRPVQWEG